MRKYELMTIIKPNLDAEEVEKVIDKISATVTELGGSIDNVDKTGRKKLAYDIQNFRDGFFTTMTLELPADKVAEFKRQLRLNDSLLRTMFMEVAQKASV
ncbi:MAG TPA: 30S ribosomal protein S6 [Cyanobacteria bacterium UBA11991]|nr:30S ribosomal protein S6 [Cyanobacteriota bacterium]MDY6358410.1 30S ribosomal protein S6 [Cyanobacteriota bacterium]MDY6364775.1 30S ribosomal protein S6 [Cyanobacteriota bacterium]MDY6383825.1 30S ribosomal protein S6 [Cyanobacteriota bacterium]HCB11546.1 30S ribosomal protein S6 [Cyanobacteria bacterium UBA11991]